MSAGRLRELRDENARLRKLLGLPPEEGRRCANCGALITDRRRHAVYCSGACRAAASYQRRTR